MNHRAAALGSRDPAPSGGILKTLALIGLGGAAAYLIWPWRSRAEQGDPVKAPPNDGDGNNKPTCACGRPLPSSLPSIGNEPSR